MRAVSKADYGKGGNIPSYEVLKVVTDGGEFNPDEMYFHDYDEDTEYMCWEERRADFAKSAMQGKLADHTAISRLWHCACEDTNTFHQLIAESAVQLADALIAELKKKGE